MQMSPEEIVRDYLQAKNKSKQIKILADRNVVTPAEIRAVLAEAGLEGVEAPKRIVRRKKPSALPPPEAEAPPSAAPEPPKEAGPEVYRKIENILAALPEDMGVKARWAAGKMVAEVFAEYLMVRLGLNEDGGNISCVQLGHISKTEEEVS